MKHIFQLNSSITDRKKYFHIAAACFLIQAVGIGTFVTFGVFFTSLVEEFEWPRAVVSGASSTAFLLSGMTAVLIGRLNDSYGPRILMSIAACMFGAGMMLSSLITQVWQLYLFYGLIFGLGLGAIDVIALTTTARWFTHSRGMMTGLVKVGTGAGQFAIPFVASLLITAYGWRKTYVILGVISLVSLFLFAQILRRDPGELHARREGGQKQQQTGQQAAESGRAGLRSSEALRTSQMWLLLLIVMITVYCLLTILVHIVPHAADLGLTPTQAAGILSTIGGVSIAGRFATGIGIDLYGCRFIAIICFAALAASFILLLFSHNLWLLFVFGAIYGLAHGSFFTFISPIVVEIFGLSAHGAIFGLTVFSGTVGGALGPIIAGRLFDISSSYDLVFKILTVLSFLVLGLVLLLKPIGEQQAVNPKKKL